MIKTISRLEFFKINKKHKNQIQRKNDNGFYKNHDFPIVFYFYIRIFVLISIIRESSSIFISVETKIKIIILN